DQVRVSNDKLKVFEIFRRKCGQADARIGQIDSFVGPKPRPACFGLGNLDAKRATLDLPHDSAYFAVVEPNLYGYANHRENLRQRARDRRRTERPSVRIDRSAFAQDGFSRDQQEVAFVKQDSLLAAR